MKVGLPSQQQQMHVALRPLQIAQTAAGEGPQPAVTMLTVPAAVCCRPAQRGARIPVLYIPGTTQRFNAIPSTEALLHVPTACTADLAQGSCPENLARIV